MKAAHDPLFTGEARIAFCAALTKRGINYNALALDLQSAGLPRPSAGNARYRTLILSLIRVGDEPWELADRIGAAYRADLHTGYNVPPAPPVEAPIPVEPPPAPRAPAGAVPVTGAQIRFLKRLGAAPDHVAAATVARMTTAQRAAAVSLASRLSAIPECRVAVARLA